MDLSSMSLNELRRLQSKIEVEIRRRADTTRRSLLKKIKKMAADEGLSLNDVIGDAGKAPTAATTPGRKRGTAAPKRKSKLPVKYHHPEKPGIGWSGRGRKPQWVIDWLAKNKPLEGLEKPAKG